MSTAEFDPRISSSPLWRLLAPSLPSPSSSCCAPDCYSVAPLTCSGCHAVNYCSKEHQRLHWTKHRTSCSPFKIVTSPTKGRHLVATRNINPGEVILQELPLTAGPCQYTPPVCLGCYRPASLTGPRCSGCSWPVCGTNCETKPLHRAECKVFSRVGLKPTQLKRNAKVKEEEVKEEEVEEHPIYECVTALRVCLVLLEKRENWAVVKALATHREERQLANNAIHNQHNIVTFLLEHAKLEQTLPGITAADITRANDVLDVNAFEIRGQNYSIRGLYPVTAMMNSTCSPNTQNSIDSDWMCRVRAVRHITKGEEITDTYTHTLTNTIARRKQLKTTKYFDCTCARCADPIEMGSHFSTLLCRIGDCQGFVLCKDPLDTRSGWVCMKCGGERDGEDVRKEQEDWEERVEAAPKDILQQESLLEQLRKIYHPGHNMCTDVMFNLVSLYGIRGGGATNQSPIDLTLLAHKKEKLCEDLLAVMNVIIPGLFRIRGMFLVELYSTKLFLLRSKLHTGQSSKSQFVRRLAGLRPLLVEAKQILGYEPEGSLEASRLVQAEKYLSQLESVVENAGKTLVSS